MDNVATAGHSFGNTVGGTFADAIGRIVGFLPHLIAGLVILAVGLIVAWALALGTRKVLHGVGFDRFMERHEVVKRGGEARASTLTGRIVYWVVALVTFVAAADALDLPWVTAGLARITAYLPNVLAAALVGVAAYILGNIAYRALLRAGTSASLAGPRLARTGIYVLAGFMAMRELNIASSIVTLCFAFLVGAMAVAAAISFGIGNRQLAGEITRDWYKRGRRVATTGMEEPGEIAERHIDGENDQDQIRPSRDRDLFPPHEPRH